MSLKWKSLVTASSCVSFGLLLFSLPAFGQTTTIEGIVKDPDGKPLHVIDDIHVDGCLLFLKTWYATE